jgi:hypothetical protein
MPLTVWWLAAPGGVGHGHGPNKQGALQAQVLHRPVHGNARIASAGFSQIGLLQLPMPTYSQDSND